MQTVGPYRLLGALGTCDVGGVWSAVDNGGQRLTVAILDAAAASNQGWRDAFQATAYALSEAQDDTLPIVNSDYSAAAPWVACADEPGPGAAQVFLALGREYRPVPPAESAANEADSAPEKADPARTEADPAKTVEAGTAATEPAWAQPTPDPFAALEANLKPHYVLADNSLDQRTPAQHAPDQRTPDQSTPAPGTSTPSIPAQSTPEPSTAPDRSLVVQPVSATPISGMPISAYPMNFGPPPRRMGWWIALVAVVSLALGAGGAVITGALGGGSDSATADPSPTPSVDLGLPATPPSQPGIEPPQGSSWPEDWPKFSATDPIRYMDSLTGVGFTFKVPRDWDCVQAAHTSGYVKYGCGQLPEIGGDLIVRQCPKPCTEERQQDLRMAEEAWGIRWTRSGRFVSWGQTGRANGADRYGLVYVAYWRSVPEDAVDRQLVFRMTAPPNRSAELRKVINSIRQVTFTL